MTVSDLSTHSDYWHSTNMVGVSRAVLASSEFNAHPIPQHMSGVRNSAASLFISREKQTAPQQFSHIFQDYIDVIFGFDNEKKWSDTRHGKRRYHNNCIYMQLDMLYEFCQWFFARFDIPAKTHKTLYRGVTSLEEYCLDHNQDKHHKQLRFNNLFSFTDQIDIVSQFGGYILKTDVPMVKLVFFNDLLPHHALHGEAEYLAIGGDYHVTEL